MEDERVPPVIHSPDTVEAFRKCWTITSTANNNLTLYGFRRFTTAHLLSLRLLEEEIAQMDRTVYEAGLTLDANPTPNDVFGPALRKIDSNATNISETITPEFTSKLRGLLKEYDDALAAFNTVMRMESFLLVDDEKLSTLWEGLTLHGIYNTRLARIDMEPRSRPDPFQRWLHQRLRAFRYWRLAKKQHDDGENGGGSGDRRKWSYQSNLLTAEIVGRLTTMVLTSAFLIVPLVILSFVESMKARLVVISVCILVLCSLISMFLWVSSFEMMAATAAYAAVLSVFVANSQ